MQTIKMLSTKEFEHWLQAQTQVIIRYRQVEKSDILAQYALESTAQPLGISQYQLAKLIPDDFRGTMPTIEEIENELNDKDNE